MKKKIILLALIVLYHLNVFSQEVNNFTLSGKVNGRSTGLIRLSYFDKNGKGIKDTTFLKDGFFSFRGLIDGPSQAILLGNTKSSSSDDPNFIELFLEPGKMQIALTENKFKNATVTGSNTQNDMTFLRNKKESITKKENTVGVTLQEINDKISKGDTSLLLRNRKDSVWNKHLICLEEERKIDYAFIASHPASCLSPYLMNYYFGGSSRKLPLDSAELFFNKFTKEVKASSLGKNINNQIIQRKASAVGQQAPAFIKADTNGKELNLYSFKGKSYVLLSFWASWCVPCRKDHPHLMEVYQKYHSKGLDIIGISWDSDKKAWKNAIKADSIGIWYQLFANIFQTQPVDNGLRATYSVATIPTLVLIDKEGKIIGRYKGAIDEGDDMALDKKLSEVFNGDK